jgi:hypothetical protein
MGGKRIHTSLTLFPVSFKKEVDRQTFFNRKKKILAQYTHGIEVYTFLSIFFMCTHKEKKIKGLSFNMRGTLLISLSFQSILHT